MVVQRLFQPATALFQPPSAFSVLYSDLAFSLTIRRVRVNSGGFGYTRGASQLTVVDLFKDAV